MLRECFANASRTLGECVATALLNELHALRLLCDCANALGVLCDCFAHDCFCECYANASRLLRAC
eukprot:8921487-Lingulodinium_polyedra.AAC.1